MDVDLQDPPELIVDFVSHWRDGYDVVYGRRVSRDADENVKRASAGFFYRIFNRISPTKIESNVGDYRLMSRVAVQATLLLRERNRFMKGIFAWVGFRSTGVPYARPERVAGTTKFNYWAPVELRPGRIDELFDRAVAYLELYRRDPSGWGP